ncbi:phytanoyl-CoA dioxygenase family protein [Tundrisphaera sp. TA3]|uniref:phytanoyl-CoA dioxygenase family protein n=1 Tax=Tundrisphaera sp. TA3 TaxID=3435775 RepID=UPI003EC01341
MTRSSPGLGAAVEQDGFAVVADVVPAGLVDRVLSAVEEARSESLQRDGETYGMRDLLRAVPEARRIAGDPVLLGLAETIVGPGAFAVRGLWFDKTDGANWGVPWHQDTTIAVRERREAAGFGPWTVKMGITHVRPPASVLEGMVTLRLHMDDCDTSNGPLRVIPGSHRGGRLDARESSQWLDRASAVECLVPRGGVILMRPLILHSSSAATAPHHRRVLHLEYAARPLTGGLEWFERVGRNDS